MRNRLIALLLMGSLFVASGVGLQITERHLLDQYRDGSGTKPTLVDDLPAGTTGEAAAGTQVLFDPVSSETAPYLWERENQFLLMEQANRIGWGPEIRRQVPREPASNAIRVVVAGDSFVWGQSVEDLDMRWDQVLERELNRLSPEQPFEVISLGKGATSTMIEAEWLSEKRLAKLKPDAFVLGFVSNDYMPTYNEKGLCEKLNLCPEDDKPPYAGCGARCDMAACLVGESSPFGKFMRNIMNPFYPNVTRWLLLRYCDPDKINAGLGLLKESSVVQDPENSPSWPMFNKAVEDMSRATKDIPRFLVGTRTRHFVASQLGPAEKLFEKNGFTLVPMEQTAGVVSETQTDMDVSINPADAHPGPTLTFAYAADTALQILKTFKITPAVGARAAVRSGNPLVSNFLPMSMIAKENSATSATFSFVGNQVEQFYTTSANVNGKQFQPQAVPCARMGRPHVRLMLNPYLAANRQMTLTLEQAGVPLVIQPVGYDKDGNMISMSPFAASPGENVSLILADGITGFLIGATKAGCPENGPISLDAFRVRLDVNQ